MVDKLLEPDEHDDRMAEGGWEGSRKCWVEEGEGGGEEEGEAEGEEEQD